MGNDCCFGSAASNDQPAGKVKPKVLLKSRLVTSATRRAPTTNHRSRKAAATAGGKALPVKWKTAGISKTVSPSAAIGGPSAGLAVKRSKACAPVFSVAGSPSQPKPSNAKSAGISQEGTYRSELVSAFQMGLLTRTDKCSTSNLDLTSTNSSVLSKQSSSADGSPRPNTPVQSVAKQNFYFRYDRTCAMISDLTALKKTRLYQDQFLQKTATGEEVYQKSTRKLMTLAMLNKARANPDTSAEVRTIVMPPFSNMDLIVPGVYLTGFYGILEETVESASVTPHIRLIINATNELPMYRSKKVASYRVPVADSEQEPIELYLEDVADLIEHHRRQQLNSVVHCMAGVSRSTTVLLAYLVKYTSMTLQEAFLHCKSIRPCIRPNMSFFRQLIEYERKVNGKASTTMVEMCDQETQLKAIVPDFYPSQCPDLFHVELDRQAKRSIQ